MNTAYCSHDFNTVYPKWPNKGTILTINSRLVVVPSTFIQATLDIQSSQSQSSLVSFITEVCPTDWEPLCFYVH